MGYYLTIFCLLGIGLGCSPLAVGATDGQPGPSSQGKLQISLYVPPQIQLSGLQDLALTNAGVATASADTRFCVYSRSGQYQLAAYGSGDDASFILSQAAPSLGHTQRSYQLAMDDGTGLRPLTSGVALTGLAGADPESLQCDNTGPNAQLHIRSTVGPNQRQQPGHYQGTLTLTVAPE